ncbi:MAG: hypothetical protein AB1325_13530 [Nitrospirota bacterium]
MSNLFKILLFTSPVLGLFFYYVVSEQSRINTEIKKDDAAFERSWNEDEADFAKGKEQKQKYLDRAAKAEEKLKELEQKEKEKEQKSEKFKKDFEKAIEDYEKEQQKGGS